MSEERTPADEYRDARAAYGAANRRHFDLCEQTAKADREAVRCHAVMVKAQEKLLRWVANDE